MVADTISFFLYSSSSSLCIALFCCVFCCQLSEKDDVTCHAVTTVDHNIDQCLSAVIVTEFLGWPAKSFLCLPTNGKTNSTFFLFFFLSNLCCVGVAQ